MKQILFSLIFIATALNAVAQASQTTANQQATIPGPVTQPGATTGAAVQATVTTPPLPPVVTVATVAPCSTCCDKSMGSKQELLVTLPVLLFVLLLFIVLLGAQKAGFNFKQAFYCDDPEDITTQLPTDPAITIKTTLMEDGKPVYYPSTSKLIAFLTALTTLIVIISFITYYAYCLMKCRALPQFKELFEVIAGLGLGIIPYGISKITNAAKQ